MDSRGIRRYAPASGSMFVDCWQEAPKNGSCREDPSDESTAAMILPLLPGLVKGLVVLLEVRLRTMGSRIRCR